MDWHFVSDKGSLSFSFLSAIARTLGNAIRTLTTYLGLHFYERQLVILASICFLLILFERLYVSTYQRRHKHNDNEEISERLENGSTSTKSLAVNGLTRKYLLVYGIVMAADWLQGPYLYTLYREQHNMPERLVALLFVTGFLSAGLAAPVVGVWADQYGRRRLCLTFCVTYTITCVLILYPIFPLLIVGRLFGGFSTSILFSAFESWLISSASTLELPSARLSVIMGRASFLNGLMATFAGIVSNKLVTETKNVASPYMASAVLLILAFVVIGGTWSENYGSGSDGSGVTSTRVDADVFQIKRICEAWNIVRRDPMLLVLGLVQTCFEGSMYLFVFVWVPSLQEVTSIKGHLPLGYIFSSFMISMMIGSILYTTVVAFYTSKGIISALTIHATFSCIITALGAIALLGSVISQKETVRFWAFCTFEVCVGMYYPVQGMLRGMLITNEHRATLSSFFRLPLNMFVVISLLTGVSSARQMVLGSSVVALGVSSVLTSLVIVERPTSDLSHQRDNT